MLAGDRLKSSADWMPGRNTSTALLHTCMLTGGSSQRAQTQSLAGATCLHKQMGILDMATFYWLRAALSVRATFTCMLADNGVTFSHGGMESLPGHLTWSWETLDTPEQTRFALENSP